MPMVCLLGGVSRVGAGRGGHCSQQAPSPTKHGHTNIAPAGAHGSDGCPRPGQGVIALGTEDDRATADLEHRQTGACPPWTRMETPCGGVTGTDPRPPGIGRRPGVCMGPWAGGEAPARNRGAGGWHR